MCEYKSIVYIYIYIYIISILIHNWGSYRVIFIYPIRIKNKKSCYNSHLFATLPETSSQFTLFSYCLSFLKRCYPF